MSIPSIDPEAGDYFYNGTIPERMMLIAVLERAMLDLKPNVDRRVRKDVIAWFEYGDAGDTYSAQFTFAQVVRYLELSGSQMEEIRRRVVLAKKSEMEWEHQRSLDLKIAVDWEQESYRPIYRPHHTHPYA